MPTTLNFIKTLVAKLLVLILVILTSVQIATSSAEAAPVSKYNSSKKPNPPTQEWTLPGITISEPSRSTLGVFSCMIYPKSNVGTISMFLTKDITKPFSFKSMEHYDVRLLVYENKTQFLTGATNKILYLNNSNRNSRIPSGASYKTENLSINGAITSIGLKEGNIVQLVSNVEFVRQDISKVLPITALLFDSYNNNDKDPTVTCRDLNTTKRVLVTVNKNTDNKQLREYIRRVIEEVLPGILIIVAAIAAISLAPATTLGVGILAILVYISTVWSPAG
jgi:hypothetical protein